MTTVTGEKTITNTEYMEIALDCYNSGEFKSRSLYII